MDPIAGLLDGPRARRAFLLRCTLDPPWALHIRDEAPLSLVAMLRGRACFAFDGGEPLARPRRRASCGPDHYLFADDPATPPRRFPRSALHHPDGRRSRRCAVRQRWQRAGRCHRDPDRHLQRRGRGQPRLLDALPPRLVLRRDEWETLPLGLLAAEMLRDEVGQTPS
jgi:hypothetical protein